MRHRARSLHILALAPVAAIVAGVLGPTPRALAAPAKAPVPIVITVDAAFGGQPTPAQPMMRFDPGAIGTNGLLEKDVDLDVATRLAALLRADLVDVVMTRTSDLYVSAARRLQISNSHHGSLLVSVEAGSSKDPHAAGSQVVYPNAASLAFAQTLSDALAAQLTGDGVQERGVVQGDAAWARSRMPAAGVEMGYLSNVGEAALMATPAFREDVATGMRNGLESYLPAIVARRSAILAWRAAHPGAASPALAPAGAKLPEGKGFQFVPVIAWLLGIALAGLVILWRDQVARVLVVLIAVVVRALGGLAWVNRAMIRRRRRRQRERAGPVAARASAPEPRRAPARGGSVYDDIPL